MKIALLSIAATMTILAACAPKRAVVPKPMPPAMEEAAPRRPDVSIEVNIPALEFTLYENGEPKFVKPIAIGQGVYPTPEQESSIKKIEWNPWWYPPPADWAKDEKVTPPGPSNPMGLVKMPLSDDILFHGTNKERSVGTPASHGCMRMLNEDAVETAWYIQIHFSEKNDPALRDLYRKNRKTTYVVTLDEEVPVRLVYRPVVAKGNNLVFYHDYYKKIASRKLKKQTIVDELTRIGKAIGEIDEAKIDDIAAGWPERGTEVPIASLLIAAPEKEKPVKETPRRKHKHMRNRWDG